MKKGGFSKLAGGAAVIAVVMALLPRGSLAQTSDSSGNNPGAAASVVNTCADLADIDHDTMTTLTIGSSDFACDEYTRFIVETNMTLKANVSTVKFVNFALKVRGSLTVEPSVVFIDVVKQARNGGVLSVGDGASATFTSTAEFRNNSIILEEPECSEDDDDCTTTATGVNVTYSVKKGGAIYNKGLLTFEEDATFINNRVLQIEGSGKQGMGGAIYNAGRGTIFFKGNLTIENNDAEEGLGGGIYTRGNITVDGESIISLNSADRGGAIYQDENGRTTFNDMASIADNMATEVLGGAIVNYGGVMDFNAGCYFEVNYVFGFDNGGQGAGGAIFNGNGGLVTLTTPTTFKENNAFWGGAIYSDSQGYATGDNTATTTYPADANFENNTAGKPEYCPDVNLGGIVGCAVV